MMQIKSSPRRRVPDGEAPAARPMLSLFVICATCLGCFGESAAGRVADRAAGVERLAPVAAPGVAEGPSGRAPGGAMLRLFRHFTRQPTLSPSIQERPARGAGDRKQPAGLTGKPAAKSGKDVEPLESRRLLAGVAPDFHPPVQ